MLKEFRRFVFVLCFMICIPTAAKAADIIMSGNCGTYDYNTQAYADNATYTLDSDGTLTISGTGACCYLFSDYVLGNEYKNAVKKLVVEEGIYSISDEAFFGCKNLENISLDFVVEIRSGALNDTAWFNNQPNGPVYAGKVFYYYKGDIAENTTLKLREDTVSMSDNMASLVFTNPNRSNITNIIFPNSLQIISGRALDGYGWTKNQPQIIYINDILYGYNVYSEEEQPEEILIKDGTRTICPWAFHSGMGYPICDNVKSVYIPTTLTYIGECAFLECDSLTDLYYMGTEEQWNNTNMTVIAEDDNGGSNSAIFNANVHFLGTQTPVPKILNTSSIVRTANGYTVDADFTDVPYDCTLIAAAYDGDKTVGVATEDIKIGDTETSLEISAPAADTIKIFIWNIKNMKPLSDVYEKTV